MRVPQNIIGSDSSASFPTRSSHLGDGCQRRRMPLDDLLESLRIDDRSAKKTSHKDYPQCHRDNYIRLLILYHTSIISLDNKPFYIEAFIDLIVRGDRSSRRWKKYVLTLCIPHLCTTRSDSFEDSIVRNRSS